MTIKAIIFDFDGVILDSNEIKTQAFIDLYKDYPSHIVKRVRTYHLQNQGIDRYRKIKYFEEELLNKEVDDIYLKQRAEIFKDLVFRKVIKAKFIKGAKNFLKENLIRFDFHLASATPEDELKDITKKRDIDVFFKSIYGSPMKKEEILSKIISEYDYNTREVVMIGDSKQDLIASKAKNVKFVAVNHKDNKSFRNEIVINDLDQLNHALDEI